jgi:hypothetical protein
MKKTWIISLIVVAVAVTLAFGVLTMTVVLKSFERENRMWTYLEPYETKAVEFLRQDQEFIALYGEDVTLEGRNIRYRFTDPKKYTGISFNPQIPASAEEFAAELDSLTVSFELPDLRVVTVTFARTPDGTTELTGWEFTEE